MSVTPDPHSPRYFALLYSPEPQRRTLEALFGIEREIAESLRPGIDHHVAHSRLQWWREECERTAAGKPVHPLTRALLGSQAGAAAKGNADAGGGSDRASVVPVAGHAGLAGFVDTGVWDLAGATFESRRELTAYCERWGAAMLGSFGLQALGTAMREFEMLGDFAREAHRGRLRLPLDELESANALPDSLARPPWPDAVVALLRARHRTLRDEMARASAAAAGTEQATRRGVLVWAALLARASHRIDRALPHQAQPKGFDAFGDTWYAWRMARKATLGQFRLS